MGRGSKVGFKLGSRRRVKRIDKGSDESDEDYIVGEDEGFDESEEEEYVSSFDGDESEESLAKFEEEEEDEDEDEEEEFAEKKVKKVGRPKKGIPGRKRNGAVKPKNKKRILYREEDEYDECDDSDECIGGRRNEVAKPRKKNIISYREKDDENYDDSDDDDEEFTLDEVHDDVDDEDVMVETKKNKKLSRPRMQVKTISKGQKRKRNAKVSKKSVKKKQRENRGLPRKSRHNNDVEFEGSKTRLVENEKKITGRGGRRRVLLSDSGSDFVNSGLSDYEYTISEEEREQVREANEFCSSFTTTLRSSTPVKKSRKEQESVYPQRKRLVRKGKEKEERLKIGTGKLVCGICLTEEGKRTVRGTLNCCSHYFCFACIIEWSKVESRCPLCKQRFVTISKPERSDTGFELRSMVIQIPERDQVYQPSEEELWGYMDPYENVICTECHHGGDDALMLLCDLCDSPAHTYCVGLGREVPEGNWYCEGCRPTALDSSNPQGLNPAPDHRPSNNLSGGSPPITNMRETFDLNEAYVPDTPLAQGTGQPSPRFFGADFQASSPASGSGAFTLYERRRIQRQIHQIFSNRRQQDTGTNDAQSTVTGNSLFGSQVGRIRELAPQRAVAPEGRIASHHRPFEGRLQGSATYVVQNSDAFPPLSTHLRSPVISSQASTSSDSSFGGLLQNGFPGFNTRNSLGSSHQQIHPCSGRSNIGSDASLSPHQCREVSPFNVGKEQVQSMVKSQLKSLYRELELGYSTFKDVARSSTHTILAACGLEHCSNEIYPVQALLICSHVEGKAGGQLSPSRDHCSSCFDLFVRNVVREIMSSRVALSLKD